MIVSILSIFSMIGIVSCAGTLLFVDLGWAPLGGNYRPTYEAAIAYGVLSIASTSLLRLFIDNEKSKTSN